jgi:hypothetical protein
MAFHLANQSKKQFSFVQEMNYVFVVAMLLIKKKLQCFNSNGNEK